MLNGLMYVDDLVLVSEIIDGLGNKFLKWKFAFESKSLMANINR